MFRLKKACCLILGAIASGTFTLATARAVNAQVSQLLPCPRPSEMHLWGVRIYRDDKRTMTHQTSLIASLVADVSGLASSRRCTWKISTNQGTSVVEGWQIEVASQRNALKVVAAAQKMGLNIEIPRN